MGTPYFANSCLPWYSWIFTVPWLPHLSTTWIGAIPPRRCELAGFRDPPDRFRAGTEGAPTCGMTARLRKLVRDQRGATMVEYAVLLFLVLVVAAAVYQSVGKKARQAGDMTAQQFN